LGGAGSEATDELRLKDRKLASEKRTAIINFCLSRRSIAWWSAFDDIQDIDVLTP
jgi:hypothetical protein